MDNRAERLLEPTRRAFLGDLGLGLGGMALAALGARAGGPAAPPSPETGAVDLANPFAPRTPPLPAKAKSVIYLHMSGAPPQQELFDWKPKLKQFHMQPCPDELLKGQRFPFIKGHPKLLGASYPFRQHGQAGHWMSSLLPELAKVADKLTVVKSLRTDQFNHAPAELFLFTGSPQFGGASLGSWITYGLGSPNQNLPGYVVLISGGTDPTGGKSLWSTGFLPTVFQGVQCRAAGEPILYLSDPAGMGREQRGRTLAALKDLNEAEGARFGDAETRTRISQYELAFRMQAAVPDAMDIGREAKATLDEYGAVPGQASLAANCLLARRLVERGVRFVQLFDWGWDIHGTGPGDDVLTALPAKCRQMDRPVAALLRDLDRRGLLAETLVVWGGEFGRTSMNEARGGSPYLGRDHHPHCFTVWLAGGGIKPGVALGETDELGYHVVRDPVSIRDLQATVLHLCGLDPWRFSYSYQGLDQRLIGPAGDARLIRQVLA